MKLTRRELAATVVAATAIAQTTSQPAPADDLQTARDRMKTNGDALAHVPLPMSIEPAFQFKA
jgi:hypothetical protein